MAHECFPYENHQALAHIRIIEDQQAEITTLRQQLEYLAGTVEVQNKELAQYKADAERYLVVRDEDHGEESGFLGVDGEVIYGTKLDKYCDQFIANNTPVPGWKPECDPMFYSAIAGKEQP